MKTKKFILCAALVSACFVLFVGCSGSGYASESYENGNDENSFSRVIVNMNTTKGLFTTSNGWTLDFNATVCGVVGADSRYCIFKTISSDNALDGETECVMAPSFEFNIADSNGGPACVVVAGHYKISNINKGVRDSLCDFYLIDDTLLFEEELIDFFIPRCGYQKEINAFDIGPLEANDCRMTQLDPSHPSMYTLSFVSDDYLRLHKITPTGYESYVTTPDEANLEMAKSAGIARKYVDGMACFYVPIDRTDGNELKKPTGHGSYACTIHSLDTAAIGISDKTFRTLLPL